jgi:peptidoglycan/LPS O-acetylase OafA/YrhL
MTEINPKMGYRPDIQALRGLAVLIVVAYHAGLPIKGGFVGVDISFVISGYVISQLVFVRFQDNRFSLQQFFERRILRLVPLLTLVNLVTVLIAFNPFGEFQQVTEAMKFATFFSANYYFFTSNAYLELAYHPLRHLWFLAVGEQFYLVFPFLLIGLFALAKRLRSSVPIPAMFLVFGGVSLFLCLNATRNPLVSVRRPWQISGCNW